MTAEIGKLGPSEFRVELMAESDTPGQLSFYFTGEKPGRSTLIFKTAVNPKWVKADSESELASLAATSRPKRPGSR